jgi:cytochrome c peroxidase
LRSIATLSAAIAASIAISGAIAQETYEWRLPRGFPVPAVPPDNPMSAAKVALGRRLFFETRLSITGEHSCASCHSPERAFSDGRARAIGATGQMLELNSMALVNVAYNISYGWAQPQVRSLEDQMLQPLLNEHPVEMGLKGREQQVLAALAKDASYEADFASAFPGSPAIELHHVIKAIAAFERTLIFGRSPFDRYVFEGDHDALTDRAKRGMEIFFSTQGGCASCHSGFNFSGQWRDAAGDTGEPTFAVNGTSTTAMRVPTLRNIALTAPYMHDGRFDDLEAVLDHYASLEGKSAPAAALSESQRRDLIAFLKSLTDTTPR